MMAEDDETEICAWCAADCTTDLNCPHCGAYCCSDGCLEAHVETCEVENPDD